MEIKYIREPTDLQCGQAVLAMLLKTSAENICAALQNDRETTLKEMLETLSQNGFRVKGGRREANSRDDLPRCALLSLETPRCWHWSLFFEGKFYDPEHGVSDDFPECKRKYFWEIEQSER